MAGNLIGRKRLLEVFRTYLERLGIEGWYAKANALVEQLTARNFILCHYGANHFGFVHRTFLEYFCATWFYDQELTIEQLKDLYGAHWQDEKWHEVLRLIAGMLKPDKAEAIIRFLMEQDGQEHKYENMMLAAGCLSEVRKRHEIQETDAELLRMFKTKVDDWTMNSLFPQFGTYEEQLILINRIMISISYTWRSEDTRRWLTLVAKHNTYALAIQWLSVHLLAVGRKDHPDTLPWLLEYARNDKLAATAAAVKELADNWKNHPDTLPLLQDRARNAEEPMTRQVAFMSLANDWKNHPDTRPMLLDLAHNDEDAELRSLARKELVRLWPTDPEVIALLPNEP